jgi:hypothetical protein
VKKLIYWIKRLLGDFQATTQKKKKVPRHDKTQLEIEEYLRRKKQKRLVPNSPRKRYYLEVTILQLRFDYLFV